MIIYNIYIIYLYILDKDFNDLYIYLNVLNMYETLIEGSGIKNSKHKNII